MSKMMNWIQVVGETKLSTSEDFLFRCESDETTVPARSEHARPVRAGSVSYMAGHDQVVWEALFFDADGEANRANGEMTISNDLNERKFAKAFETAKTCVEAFLNTKTYQDPVNFMVEMSEDSWRQLKVYIRCEPVGLRMSDGIWHVQDYLGNYPTYPTKDALLTAVNAAILSAALRRSHGE